MAWFKVDDKFHSHPKIKRIPRRLRRAAIGLWTIAGSWCADYETDGAVPEYMLEEFDADAEEVDALVDAELWERTEDGVAFRNWGEFQPTRAQLDEKRAQTAERVQKFRQKKRQNHTEESVARDDGNAVTGALVTQVKRSPRTRPVPVPTTTPLPPEGELFATPEPSQRAPKAFVYPDSFERLWKAWPKSGDNKRSAFAAWEKATKGTSRKAPRITTEELQSAVEAYAADPNLPPNQYIPAASKWLNQDYWENGPLPPRGGGNGRPQAGDTHRAMQRSYSAAQSYRALEESGYYDQQITPHMRRTA